MDLTQSGSYLAEGAKDLRRQRDKIVAAANPKVARFMRDKQEEGGDDHHDKAEPEPKRLKLSSTQSVHQSPLLTKPGIAKLLQSSPALAQVRYQPIMPKVSILNSNQPSNQHTNNLTRQPHTQTSTSIVLLPKVRPAHLVLQALVRGGGEGGCFGDNSEEEDGITVADSLGINSEDSDDGLADLKKKLTPTDTVLRN